MGAFILRPFLFVWTMHLWAQGDCAEMEIASTALFVTLGALISVVLYVWFLVSGTKRIYDPESTQISLIGAYATVMTGIFLFGIGLGLLITVLWAVIFGTVDAFLVILITYGVGMLYAVFYLKMHEPNRNNTPT